VALTGGWCKSAGGKLAGKGKGSSKKGGQQNKRDPVRKVDQREAARKGSFGRREGRLG